MSDKGKEDLRMLDDLLNDNIHELSEAEVEAFADMRFEHTAYEAIRPGQAELTEKQRSWVKSVHDRVTGGTAENLVSRGLVPRGREVEPAPVLKNLPKSPPGRIK